MDFDRRCTEMVSQTELLVTDVKGTDLRSPVPSCPGWTLGMLLRHIGGGQRWAEETVRTRASGFLPDDQLRKLDGDDSGEVQADWLLAGATRLADTLRAAGPAAEVWTPLDLDGGSAFWARRFTNETLMHRADATLAAGTTFTVAEDVALDAVDEWMWLDALPKHFEYQPAKRDLLGPGRTLSFEATDTDAAWFIDLTGDVIRSGRARKRAAVTVRTTLTGLLLAIYVRKPMHSKDIELSGDVELLDLWLTHIGFA
jgi:uncharacterized protein (TIGR03083 family)